MAKLAGQEVQFPFKSLKNPGLQTSVTAALLTPKAHVAEFDPVQPTHLALSFKYDPGKQVKATVLSKHEAAFESQAAHDG